MSDNLKNKEKIDRAIKQILFCLTIINLSSCAALPLNMAKQNEELVFVSEPRMGLLDKVVYYYQNDFMPRKIEVSFDYVEPPEEVRYKVLRSIKSSYCLGKRIDIAKNTFSEFKGSFQSISFYHRNAQVGPAVCDISQITIYIDHDIETDSEKPPKIVYYRGRYDEQTGWQFVLRE